MINAVEYVGAIGFGATSPQLFRGDDGQLYVVKLQNNKMGAKVLVNEYLAYWYARKLDLCFPPGGLISLSPQLLSRKRFRAAKISGSPHFGSLYLHHCRYVEQQNFAKAINKKAMAGVMLFDYMFYNIDRTKNRRNLLIRREPEGYKLYAIDNSHLFVRGKWDVKMLEDMADRVVINRRRAYGWLLRYFLHSDDFYRYAQKIKMLGDDVLQSFIDSIPIEWLAEERERQALLGFMQIRRDRVDDIVKKIIRSIPDVHRSSNAD